MIIYQQDFDDLDKDSVETVLEKHGFCLSGSDSNIFRRNCCKRIEGLTGEHNAPYEYSEYCLKDGYVVDDYKRKRYGKPMLISDVPVKLILHSKNNKIKYMGLELSKCTRYILLAVLLLSAPLVIWASSYYASPPTVVDKNQIIVLSVFCLICWSVAVLVFFKVILRIVRDVKRMLHVALQLGK